MPVLLRRRCRYGVAGLDPPRRLAALLHIALALHDVEDLTTPVPVPVVAGAGLEADDAYPNRIRLERLVQRI